jgi:hypothetical protein
VVGPARTTPRPSPAPTPPWSTRPPRPRPPSPRPPRPSRSPPPPRRTGGPAPPPAVRCPTSPRTSGPDRAPDRARSPSTGARWLGPPATESCAAPRPAAASWSIVDMNVTTGATSKAAGVTTIWSANHNYGPGGPGWPPPTRRRGSRSSTSATTPAGSSRGLQHRGPGPGVRRPLLRPVVPAAAAHPSADLGDDADDAGDRAGPAARARGPARRAREPALMTQVEKSGVAERTESLRPLGSSHSS